MSEDYQAPGERLENTLLGMASQLGVQMAEAMREPRFEYEPLGWEQVNRLARDGWEMTAAIAPAEVDRLPLDFKYGIVFLMRRKLGPADEAAALLEGS